MREGGPSGALLVAVGRAAGPTAAGSRLGRWSRYRLVGRAVSVGWRRGAQRGARLVERSTVARDRGSEKHEGRGAHQSRRDRGGSRGVGSITRARTR
jgi:hypothetical protein